MTDQGFQPVEIDLLDQKLTETATRKRIPTLSVTANSVTAGGHPGERSDQCATVGPQAAPAPRKPISIEVPDNLATALKVAAAQQSVTVRHLILSALAAQDYAIAPEDLIEDGRRLR